MLETTTPDGVKVLQLPSAQAAEAVGNESSVPITTIVEKDGVTYGIIQVDQEEEGEKGSKEQGEQEKRTKEDGAGEVESAEKDVQDTAGSAVPTGVQSFSVVEEGTVIAEGPSASLPDTSTATTTTTTTTTTTLLVEEEPEAPLSLPPPPQMQFLLQTLPSYKIDLLQSMLSFGGASSLMDLPVFCRDGVAWSSRLLLSAMSPMLKEALAASGSDEGAESAIVLPEISRAEFSAFTKAVFAKEGDESLDFVVLIKVAETLGAQIVSEILIMMDCCNCSSLLLFLLTQLVEFQSLTTDFPPSSDSLPTVDYRVLQDNPEEERKVLHSLGYDVTTSLVKGSSFRDRAIWLCEVLHSEVECPICKRRFVDQDSLKKHHATLHVGKQLSTIFK